MPGAGIGVIGDARLFVNGATDAVAAEFADDVEAAAAHFAFDGAADVFGAVAGTGCGESLTEGAFGAVGELAGFFLHRRYLDSDGRVGVIAVFHGSEVELDKVAGLDRAQARDAVDDFVVDADADVSGEFVDERWRGLCAVFGKDARANSGEFGGGDAGTNGSRHGAEGFGDDQAAGAQFFELFGGSDGHGSKCKPFRISSKGEASARSGDWTAEFLRGFDPLLDYDFDVGKRLFMAFPVGGATRKFGYFSDKGFVGLTPVDDDFVYSHRLLRPNDS